MDMLYGCICLCHNAPHINNSTAEPQMNKGKGSGGVDILKLLMNKKNLLHLSVWQNDKDSTNLSIQIFILLELCQCSQQVQCQAACLHGRVILIWYAGDIISTTHHLIFYIWWMTIKYLLLVCITTNYSITSKPGHPYSFQWGNCEQHNSTVYLVIKIRDKMIVAMLSVPKYFRCALFWCLLNL